MVSTIVKAWVPSVTMRPDGYYGLPRVLWWYDSSLEKPLIMCLSLLQCHHDPITRGETDDG